MTQLVMQLYPVQLISAEVLYHGIKPTKYPFYTDRTIGVTHAAYAVVVRE
jgi:hypothetical protein